MGLPMIVSMVLQALYNVVDSIFVTNMGAEGAVANQALTIAFPIQILIIAVGVGTGVGLNALLSRSLGEQNQEKVNRVAGNGVFLMLCIYAVFLLFGIVGAKWFIGLFAGGNAQVLSMGTSYLQICCILSLGGIGFTVYERFLQATGKTMLSTISQVAGALTNIVLDWVFIYPLKMGVAGAAWATVIGQFVSMGIAMIFHYTKNKEINGNLKYIRPSWQLIKAIYRIGISAAIMQALLTVMMARPVTFIWMSVALSMIRMISAETVITTNSICSFVDFSPRTMRPMIFAKIGTMAKTMAPSMDVAKYMARICRTMKAM